jgi:hypothetical protein
MGAKEQGSVEPMSEGDILELTSPTAALMNTKEILDELSR